jgi:hypothetical protein
MKKLALILSMLLAFQTDPIAQTPEIEWTQIHSISPEGDIDEGKCIRQTDDAGYIITGSCVPDGLVSDVDVLLLKTDLLGNIEWTKTYGRDFFEEGLAVKQTSDGGYIIGGRAVTGSYPIVDPPISDVWILKTDVTGDTLWSKVFDIPGNDYCTSIQQTTDSGYIFTGTMNSEYCYPNYEINEEYEPNSSRAFLFKTDLDGDILWTKTYDEKSYGNCVVQTNDGGFIVAGWIFLSDPNIQSDMLLIKTDSFGTTLWTKIIGGSDYDIGYCVRQIPEGYIISGQTKPAGNPYDALLIKTDSEGNVTWEKTFGGKKSDAAFTIEQSYRGYYITGTTNGTWWISNQGDMWAFEVDTNGNLIWEKIFDVALSDIAWSGITTSDGGYAISGFAGYGFGGDLWQAKLVMDPSGIEPDHNVPIGFILYQNFPNPFNPITKIKFSIPSSRLNPSLYQGEGHRESMVTLKVYDVQGKVVTTLISEQLPAGDYETTFNAKNLSSGIYYYQLKVGNHSSTKKMVILK